MEKLQVPQKHYVYRDTDANQATSTELREPKMLK